MLSKFLVLYNVFPPEPQMTKFDLPSREIPRIKQFILFLLEFNLGFAVLMSHPVPQVQNLLLNLIILLQRLR